MEKLQVLVPQDSMRRLREAAKAADRPMSEIVRRVTEDWLDSQPSGAASDTSVPVFNLGLRITDTDMLKNLAYMRNMRDFQGFGLFEVVDPVTEG